MFSDKLLNMLNNSYINKNSNATLLKAKKVIPWITPAIFRKIKKRVLHKISKRRPYDIVFKIYYNNCCRGISDEIDTVKNNYLEYLIENRKGDSLRQ